MEPASERERETASKPRRRVWLAYLALLVAMSAVVLVTWHWIAPRTSPVNFLLTRETLPAVPRERRPTTLPAAQFTGRAAEGYRIAQQRPELLERLPCYCGCYLSAGHHNNLDCFRDRHSENCEMCVSIAMEGARLQDKGYSAEDVKAIIDRMFARQQ